MIFSNKNVLSKLKTCYFVIQLCKTGLFLYFTRKHVIHQSRSVITKRGIQRKYVLFNVNKCYSVQKHVIEVKNVKKKMLINFKTSVIQHDNALINMFFALDNMHFAPDNTFGALEKHVLCVR